MQSTLSPEVTPYGNTPAVASMIPIPSKSMISATLQPNDTNTTLTTIPSFDTTPAPSARSDDETHTETETTADEPIPNTSLVAVITDSENKGLMDISERRATNTTDPGCTTDDTGTTTPAPIELKLSMENKSTPSTTPIPVPQVMNNGLQRETKVRFSIFLENTSFPDSNDEEDHSLEKQGTDRSTAASFTQSAYAYGASLPSMVEEEDEFEDAEYEGRQEMDDDGNICIVYDDDDEDEEPITINKQTEHNVNVRESEYSMAESKTNLTNLSQLEEPSTMRRVISDSLADELTTTTTTEIIYDRASKEKEIELVMKHIKQDSDRERMERMKSKSNHIHMPTKSGSSKSKSKSWRSRISYSPKMSSNTHI
eukprot:CAMPEP_0201573158 /NCGR_PEP_ID=MMETSP0190_2-20130828/16856_1 /ASSEMBLY_ACC=CAM_ASM_000263 /TAXON_ID=37353 /ORGANISM="Rosalina sp." /LENGTH=368 /DNA_ID=CAMNT_0047999793 /DNA_START=571 /DNA_END=1674 /DNA_ORIENTATION=+